MSILPLLFILSQNASFVYIQEEPHAKLTHVVIAANVVANFADISTTQYALGTGKFREANLFLKNVQSPVKMAIVKGSIATGTSYLLIKLHKKKPKTALVLACALTIFNSTFAYKNSKLIKK